MLEPIQYMTKQETMKQVCSTERAWMELLPQMGNFDWGPIWCNIFTKVDTMSWVGSADARRLAGPGSNFQSQPLTEQGQVFPFLIKHHNPN